VRLALGYSAVAIAGALFYFDWKHGWDASKAYTGPAVAVYFVLNMAFSYWMWGVEKGCVFEGEGRGGIKVRYLQLTRTCSWSIFKKMKIPVYTGDKS
jgi:hypothetical protein